LTSLRAKLADAGDYKLKYIGLNAHWQALEQQLDEYGLPRTSPAYQAAHKAGIFQDDQAGPQERVKCLHDTISAQAAVIEGLREAAEAFLKSDEGRSLLHNEPEVGYFSHPETVALAQALSTLPSASIGRMAKEKDDEAWIIVFEDADQPNETFIGHGATEAAHSRYAVALLNWNCHLFRRVANNQSLDALAQQDAKP